MKKGLLLALLGVIAVALALLGRAFWWGKPKPVTVVLTSPPTPQEALTVSGLHPPKVKPEWVKKMRQWGRKYRTPPWMTETFHTETGNVVVGHYQVPLVSTGQWDEITLTTRDGQTYHADVLYTLQLNAARQVLVVPLVMGVEHDGQYMPWPVLAQPWVYGKDPAHLTRERFLAIAKKQWGEVGKILTGIAEEPLVTLHGFQWAQCRFGKYAPIQPPPWVCKLGEAIEEQWPGYTLLVMKTALMQASMPSDFVLYGVSASAPQDPAMTTWEVKP